MTPQRMAALAALLGVVSLPLLRADEPQVQDAGAIVLDPAQVKPHGVAASVATHVGRRALRLIEPDASRQGGIALLPEVRFTDGTIEVDVAGRRGPFAVPDDRGFIGVAFRVRADSTTYEYLFIRPDNGRATDQVRRNHATQYAAHPAFTFQRLRAESPERYESYVASMPARGPGCVSRSRTPRRGSSCTTQHSRYSSSMT